MRRCLQTDCWPETEGTIGTILYSCPFGTPVALRVFEDLVEAIRVLAPHLKGFYEVKSAEFLLEPVDGGTRLTGTTRYQHGLWPAQYWAWWCGHVVKDLQHRVITHAKQRAEAPR